MLCYNVLAWCRRSHSYSVVNILTSIIFSGSLVLIGYWLVLQTLQEKNSVDYA